MPTRFPGIRTREHLVRRFYAKAVALALVSILYGILIALHPGRGWVIGGGIGMSYAMLDAAWVARDLLKWREPPRL